jgi:hypothetical protein
MHAFFAQHWDTAESRCLEMLTIEQDSGALPLSYLLRFAMRSWRILNDEFETHEQSAVLHQEFGPLRKDCLRILHTKRFPDSSRATRLFLEGGINGFNATLIIRSNPFSAMVSGLSSVRLLDSARALAPSMKDVYLGLGISQCALANEPGIIRAAMRIFSGLHVDLDTGLAYLRICSQNAQYTSEGAMEYLIQFLSPFKPDEIAEKQAIFKVLQSRFPDCPYYVFQEIDEGLAFHRHDVFFGNLVSWALPRIKSFDTCNFSLRRYANLVKTQCAAIDFSLSRELKPMPISSKQNFSFYPVFLKAARMEYELDIQKTMIPAGKRKLELRQYHRMRNHAFSMLRASDINPMLREYYLWHMQDGLP